VVLNPESVVIKETLRTFTYLHLFGYAVDAVILNRVLSPEAGAAYFADMHAAQQANRAFIEDSFAPVPILEVPFFRTEVMGPDRLAEMAASLYGERDPIERIYYGKTFTLEPVEDGRVRLGLLLPHVGKEDVRLVQRGGELAIAVGAYRRSLDLPRALHGRAVERARVEDGRLVILFGARTP
jgi:arsenite-transporting ATPase